MVLLARSMVQRRWLVAGDGSMVELRREVPMMASLGCLIRARYELHEVATVLPKQRTEDGKASGVVGHVELKLRRDPDMAAALEKWPMALTYDMSGSARRATR